MFILSCMGVSNSIVCPELANRRQHHSQRQVNTIHRLLLGLSLLLDIMLSAALLSLAGVVHVLVVLLARLVAGQASDGTTDGALETVADARSVVVELTLGFLLLALEILLATLLLKVLHQVSWLPYLP